MDTNFHESTLIAPLVFFIRENSCPFVAKILYGLTTLTVSVLCPEITKSAGAISFSKIVAERVSE